MNTIVHTFADIEAAIRANDGMFIDDHRGGREVSEQQRKAHGIAKFGKHTVLLSSAEETPYFCLNRMYLDEDGKPHLSTFSVGGVIQTREGNGLMDGIRAYNDPKNWMAGHQLTEVRDVVIFN